VVVSILTFANASYSHAQYDWMSTIPNTSVSKSQPPLSKSSHTSPAAVKQPHGPSSGFSNGGASWIKSKGDTHEPEDDYSDESDGEYDNGDEAGQWQTNESLDFDPAISMHGDEQVAGAALAKINLTICQQVVPSDLITGSTPISVVSVLVHPDVFTSQIAHASKIQRDRYPDAHYAEARYARVFRVVLRSGSNTFPFPVGVRWPKAGELNQSSLNSQTKYLAVLPPNSPSIPEMECCNNSEQMLTPDMECYGVQSWEKLMEETKPMVNNDSIVWIKKNGLLWQLALHSDHITRGLERGGTIRLDGTGTFYSVNRDSHMKAIKEQYDERVRKRIPWHDLHLPTEFEFHRLTSTNTGNESGHFPFATVEDICATESQRCVMQWDPTSVYTMSATFEITVVIPRWARHKRALMYTA
jgi:hypothetical protein